MGRRRPWPGCARNARAALLVCAAAAGVAAGASGGAEASAQGQDAKAIVQQAVRAELDANRDDNTHWRYVETELGGEKLGGEKLVVVETENGAVKRHIEENGRPASAATLAADNEATQKFIHDPALREKQKQNGAHDEKDATELLNEMPVAFTWKYERETGDEIVLSYRPNEEYRPPDMESRVMGKMAGTMIVSKPGHRIKSFKGTLSEDINIGFGVLARIKQGGTFDIERRQVAPGEWCITETHVHISGHALFFKTIGQQEDEVKSDFTQVPAGTSLEQAVGMLTQPATKSNTR